MLECDPNTVKVERPPRRDTALGIHGWPEAEYSICLENMTQHYLCLDLEYIQKSLEQHSFHSVWQIILWPVEYMLSSPVFSYVISFAFCLLQNVYVVYIFYSNIFLNLITVPTHCNGFKSCLTLHAFSFGLLQLVLSSFYMQYGYIWDMQLFIIVFLEFWSSWSISICAEARR